MIAASRPGPPPSRGGPAPASAALWGDGFADDRLSDLWAVRDWDRCATDEYILLFPRLVPRAGEVPAALRAHLETCVAVRAWRLSGRDGRGGAPVLCSRLPDPAGGARHHGDWFARDNAVTGLLRRLGVLRAAPGHVAAEVAILHALDALLAEIQDGRVPGWDEAGGTLLAFGAGIHPAYLWHEAAAVPARGVVAGWLGHLDRGRTALMPLVVAEYVLDALREGAADRQLLRLAGGERNLATLLRAARRRSDGHDPAVRLRPDTSTLADIVAGRMRRTLALGLEA